jgi:hypothetical protein
MRRMPKPFNATTQHLVEAHAADWPALAGISAEADAMPADLSTVTSEADQVLRVRAAAPWLVGIELQASYDRDLPGRSLQYNILLERRHALPVQSVLILLRPQTDGPAMTGTLHERIRHVSSDR